MATDAQLLQAIVGRSVGEFGTPGHAAPQIQQDVKNVNALLTLINEQRAAGLVPENAAVEYWEHPATPGLIGVRLNLPDEVDDFGAVTEGGVQDLGTWDITGEGIVNLETELNKAGINSQQISDEVLQQRANTEEAGQIETARHNVAAEKNSAANRALAASTAAMDAYLRGTQLADARRLSSFQEARQLLPSLVSPDREFFGGQEPGGFLDQFSEKFLGKPVKGAEVIQKTFNPDRLAAGTSGITANVAAGAADIKSKG